MARPNSTVVVLAGSGSEKVLAGLDGLANVRVASSGEAAALVGQTHAAYVVHDRDPLAGVADAWARFFDRQAPPGTLEVAIETAVADLRRGATLLPDYYLVLDPESLPATGKHWWLGVLAGAAPSRVVPAGRRCPPCGKRSPGCRPAGGGPTTSRPGYATWSAWCRTRWGCRGRLRPERPSRG
ncbi:hypothetical protein L1857_19750 [Amycolatopsis thermalba]|uniref:Uncharacterized protein n=1 Tax=Amycolatopsis thermalba TaxID=944492 RepID=A0ABY4NY03_9PSEU|nr:MULTISPECIES: hypothetical protein [Amycolatopsis]UQS24887.1 hypothetical protein L1857_19750 [Amycolatopsis thermalba]